MLGLVLTVEIYTHVRTAASSKTTSDRRWPQFTVRLARPPPTPPDNDNNHNPMTDNSNFDNMLYKAAPVDKSVLADTVNMHLCEVTSVRTIQGKVDRSDPVLIIICSSVVQYRSSTAHAESAERPVC